MTGWTRKWTLFTLVMIVVHLLLHVGIGLGGIAPDLLTATALLGARRLPLAGAIAFGFAIGLLADTFAVDGFAATGLGLAIACGLGAFSRDYFEGESLLFTAVYLLIGAGVSSILADVLAGRASGPPIGYAAGIVGSAIYTAVAGAFALATYREAAGPRA